MANRQTKTVRQDEILLDEAKQIRSLMRGQTTPVTEQDGFATAVIEACENFERYGRTKLADALRAALVADGFAYAADRRPIKCRERLRDSGERFIPRSCEVCGPRICQYPKGGDAAADDPRPPGRPKGAGQRAGAGKGSMGEPRNR